MAAWILGIKWPQLLQRCSFFSRLRPLRVFPDEHIASVFSAASFGAPRRSWRDGNSWVELYKVAPDMALTTTLWLRIPWAYIFSRSWYNSFEGIPGIPRRWGTPGSCHGHGWTREALLFRLVRSSTANAMVELADQVGRNSYWGKRLTAKQLSQGKEKWKKGNV